MDLYFTFNNGTTFKIDLMQLAYLYAIKNTYHKNHYDEYTGEGIPISNIIDDICASDTVEFALETYQKFIKNTHSAIDTANLFDWCEVSSIAEKTSQKTEYKKEWPEVKKKVC